MSNQHAESLVFLKQCAGNVKDNIKYLEEQLQEDRLRLKSLTKSIEILEKAEAQDEPNQQDS